MSKSNKTYTYRCGQKIELNKSADQIVVKMSPEALGDDEIIASEKASSASYRLTMLPENLETSMACSRELAPTHHAYYETATDQELLTTDRVLVNFHEELSDQQTLNILRGVAINGDWRLKVSDHAGADQGKLNRWAIQLSAR